MLHVGFDEFKKFAITFMTNLKTLQLGPDKFKNFVVRYW